MTKQKKNRNILQHLDTEISRIYEELNLLLQENKKYFLYWAYLDHLEHYRIELLDKILIRNNIENGNFEEGFQIYKKHFIKNEDASRKNTILDDLNELSYENELSVKNIQENYKNADENFVKIDLYEKLLSLIDNHGPLDNRHIYELEIKNFKGDIQRFFQDNNIKKLNNIRKQLLRKISVLYFEGKMPWVYPFEQFFELYKNYFIYDKNIKNLLKNLNSVEEHDFQMERVEYWFLNKNRKPKEFHNFLHTIYRYDLRNSKRKRPTKVRQKKKLRPLLMQQKQQQKSSSPTGGSPPPVSSSFRSLSPVSSTSSLLNSYLNSSRVIIFIFLVILLIIFLIFMMIQFYSGEKKTKEAEITDLNGQIDEKTDLNHQREEKMEEKEIKPSNNYVEYIIRAILIGLIFYFLALGTKNKKKQMKKMTKKKKQNK